MSAQPDVERTHPAQVRPMIAAFALATAASGLIAWRFIFPVPALFSAALAIPLVAALRRGALTRHDLVARQSCRCCARPIR